MSTFTLKYPLFDGKKLWCGTAVTVEDGIIRSVTECDKAECGEGLLIPGLIDAHTHMGTEFQVQAMLQNGVTATCDVSAPVSLVESSEQLAIVSSAGMTMGTLNGKSYVKKVIENGAKYVKVLLMEPNLMPKGVLKSICQTAHEYGLKVAVHATTVKAVRMAVDCGTDILLHVPMKEEYPIELAKEISDKGIVVAPTLVMMETFAHSGRGGYLPEHYQNAENAVKLLHSIGVTILAATDANSGSYAPAVAYGSSMHRELSLLVGAGLTTTEALEAATSKVADVFGISGLGYISQGCKATLVLVEGRPDRKITDTTKIKQIWIAGEPIL